MEYFDELTGLLKMEQTEDRRQYQEQAMSASVSLRREAGLAWYPIAIRDTELGRGDYLTVEVERTTHQDIAHQLRFGSPAALFSNPNQVAPPLVVTVGKVPRSGIFKMLPQCYLGNDDHH